MKINNVIMCLMLTVLSVPTVQASAARQNREQCCSLQKAVGIGFVCVSLLAMVGQVEREQAEAELKKNIFNIIKQCEIRAYVDEVCGCDTPSQCSLIAKENVPSLINLRIQSDCTVYPTDCTAYRETKKICTRMGIKPLNDRGMCNLNKNNSLSRQNAVCKLRQPKNNQWSSSKR